MGDQRTTTRARTVTEPTDTDADEADADADADGGPGADAERGPTVDPTVVEELRAMEASTIADTGRVLAAVVVDFDDPETTPEAVRSTVLERAGVEPDRLTATGDRVLAARPNERSVLDSQPEGKHTLLVVELAGGQVFADRLPVPGEVPRGPGGKPPGVRRAESFFEYYGGVETLPQLEGEHVEVTHDGGWRVAVPDVDADADSDSGDDDTRLPAWLGVTALATVLLAASVVSGAAGGLAGQLLVLSSVALAAALALDWLQLGAEWLARGDRP